MKKEISTISNRQLSIKLIGEATAAIGEQQAKNRSKLAKHLKDAINHHSNLDTSLGDSTYSAILVGRSLREIESIISHGQFIPFITTHFCSQLQVSVRSIQRYIKLSREFDKIAIKLQEDHPNMTERDLLKRQSFAETRKLIRFLLSNESLEVQQRPGALPEANPNGWVMPDFIVSRILDLFCVVDTDVFALPGSDPYHAVKRFEPPLDAMCSEAEWSGRIVLNPGIEGVDFGAIAERLVRELQTKNVTEALLLCPAAMTSKYAQILRSMPRAFFNGAINVIGPSLSKQIRVPLMLLYAGPTERFPDFLAAFNDQEHFSLFVPYIHI